MHQNNPPPVITIDGPGGVGKGTISHMLAERLGWQVLDSGALYRLLALVADTGGLELDDEVGLSALGRELDCQFVQKNGEARIILRGSDVSAQIRTESCANNASRIASLPGVRETLLALQRSFRRPPGLVADGRDMGARIFPDAILKIFLTASPEERARRRHKQLKGQGADVNLPSLLAEITERDRRDRGRAVSPLEPAVDAVCIDTTALGVYEVIDQVSDLVWQKGYLAQKQQNWCVFYAGSGVNSRPIVQLAQRSYVRAVKLRP